MESRTMFRIPGHPLPRDLAVLTGTRLADVQMVRTARPCAVMAMAAKPYSPIGNDIPPVPPSVPERRST